MKAVFCGTPPSSVPTLEALIENGHEVPLVVTQPDRPAGRSSTPRPSAIRQAAGRLGLEVIQPSRVGAPEVLDWLRGAAPDVLVVVGYGKILPAAVLHVPRIAPVNVHFSLLPAYRGAAPVQWALARGERTTGVSTMLMSEGLDEGDVLLQEEVAIAPRVHAPELLAQLAVLGARLLVRTLEGLAAGRVVARPQDPARVTLAPRLRTSDGVADFDRRAPELEGRVRGFDPWPGVWARRGSRRIRLVEAQAVEGPRVEEPPGSVVRFKADSLWIACGHGTVLAVRRVQPEGRRVISARDAVNGRQLGPGDRLEGGARD